MKSSCKFLDERWMQETLLGYNFKSSFVPQISCKIHIDQKTYFQVKYFNCPENSRLLQYVDVINEVCIRRYRSATLLAVGHVGRNKQVCFGAVVEQQNAFIKARDHLSAAGRE